MKKILILIILAFSLVNCTKQETGDFFRMPRKPKQIQTDVIIEEQIDENGEIVEIGDWEEEEYDKTRKVEKIKVGILLPLSGNAQKIGSIMLQSAQLAVFEGDKDNVSLTAYDTKGTAFGASEAINKAIEDGMEVILGPLFSASTEAIMNTTREKNIKVISFSNNQLLLNENDIYLMGFMPEQEIERIVSFAMDEGKTNFSALLPNDSYGALVSKILKETVERKDGKIIKIDYYFKNDKALDQKVKKLVESYAISDRVYEEYEKAKELAKLSEEENKEEVKFTYEEEDKIYADTILIPEGGKKLTQILDLIDDYSTENRKYQLLGTSKWENEVVYKNENLNGAWFVSANPEKYKEFEERFYDAYGKFPIRIASLAYDAVNVVQKVYNKSTYDVIDKEQLTNQKGFKGMDGSFRFLPNGIVERRFVILEIQDGYADVIDKSLSEFLKY